LVIFNVFIYLVRPEAIAFGAGLFFTADVFYSNREISEMRRPIGVKFCNVVNT